MSLVRCLLAVALCVTLGSTASAQTKPNVVVILADDLGIGDLSCYNAESKIKTPHLDRLASQGARLTDAHSPGAWCIPTRYGVLTGNYPYRAKKQPGLLVGEHALTLPQFLSEHGYDTAFVGKWHLGIELETGSKKLTEGPHKVGFKYSYGIPASLDIPPYYYYENGEAVALPTEQVGDSNSEGWTRIQGAFWRGGGVAPGFKHDEVLPTITRKASEYVAGRKGAADPFFLYFALTAPHTPWLPSKEFEGTSGAAMYGDFVQQVDAAVGRVLQAIDDAGLTNDTLVIFTSDNGPVWYPADREKYGHASTGVYRGMKGDLWEGGHRMPMIVRWPDEIEAGVTSDALICQTDIFRSVAEVIGAEVPEGAALDSISQVPLFQGAAAPRTDLIVRSAGRGTHLYRSGSHVLIPIKTAGGFSKFKPAPDAPPGQLYDLSTDPGEQKNLWKERPDLVKELQQGLPPTK